MQVYVNYENKKWKKYDINFEKIASAAVSTKYKNSEVSITLVGDRQIHKLNKKYRGINRPTNVLSFELQDDLLLGDIFISLDTVAKEAADANISIEEHTAHMIVHGMLHLQGYDHLNDKEAAIMEKQEIKILKNLGYKNPYDEIDSCDCECDCEYGCCCCALANKIANIKIKENSVWQYILSAVLGIVCSFGFAPFHLWMLSLIAIGGMYYLTIRQKQKVGLFKSWLIVFPFGALYGIAMFWWVLHSIYVVPELAKQFAVWTIPSLIGIGLICGIILSIPFAAIRYIKTNPVNRAVLFATTWTLVLWLREWFLTGFPWNPISNITMTLPMVINSMAFWGALGLSFVILGIIASFVEILYNKNCKSCLMLFVIYLILFLGGCSYGYFNMKQSTMTNSVDNALLIRIVQPAESAVYKMPKSRQEAQDIAEQKINDLIAWARNDDGKKPDIIVYPETAYPYVMVDNKFPLARVLNTDVIMGSNSFDKGKMYNSMVVADKNGVVKHLYSKSHLVPFGEYRPFGDIIPTPGQLTPGKGKEIITIKNSKGDFSFAPAICYEIIFTDSLVPNGTSPDAIINITNDTWFGFTPGVYQHLDMVRRYAIESGLPVIRANYSGISAFVAPDGNIESLLPVGQQGNLDGFVWGAHNTPYRTVGRNLIMIIILLFSTIVSISISLFQRKD